MSVRVHSGQFMDKHEHSHMHGRWLEVEANCGHNEDCVTIKDQYGDYVRINGVTVHHVVKSVMQAAPNWMKKDMINHLEGLLKGEETY